VLLRRGRTLSSQGELQFQAHGTLLSVSVALAPLPLADVAALCMVVTDMTKQKKLQDLQLTSRRKDEFLAMLAHELRNPLAPILNAVEALDRAAPGDQEAAETFHGVIARQVQHMKRLLDDLLDVSRVSQGKIQLRKEPAELGALLL